ncbi:MULTISPECIES: tyrosine-protein phosphatase [unclassified Oceanispirochaeta]|uniref:tyrosine-protein phosphatase n=1 Tax=unclassified Oceanispirochaeta TaxID=2635722 RepID=UPI000E098415|nr:MULTISPECIES: tyrosine-protein phosphatase [unclassified Oceanispirochaeta]MBF9014665.1 tyrosine-protein phosphatase [Oceanispirochaeta sp. M2]NPD70921.1 tyrosine-protein phosphatase [Oceanispirochaeta sp. M1]RDG33755.1 protein-tyrosine-phosphatase [Oceanispirochaeta sp. M1]
MKILNFRELSNKTNIHGQKLRSNTIFRSSNPLTEYKGDLDEIKEKQINYIYDFRSNMEIEKDGQQKVANAETIHVNILPAAGMSNDDMEIYLQNADKFMNMMYRDMLSVSKEYSSFFRNILDQETPAFLFHCTAGKDRTGIAAVILMHILEFDSEDIIEEYLKIDPELIDFLSIKFMPDSSVISASVPELELSEIKDNMFGFITVKREYLSSYYEGIEERYGDMDTYIKNFLKISSDDIKTLRRRYLEKI